MRFIKLDGDIYINTEKLISIQIEEPERDENIPTDYNLCITIEYEQGKEIRKRIGILESGTVDYCLFRTNDDCPLRCNDEDAPCNIGKCKLDTYLLREMVHLASKAKHILQSKVNQILMSDHKIINFENLYLHGAFKDTISNDGKAIYEIYADSSDIPVYTEEIEFKGYTKFIEQL